ncbi:hypothetical protein [uncultured Desulfobulbus sp.]|uniref:hypothetical protein n=1 Tax=uncultured Desulfobulbus sp. TaxID=239745 RepID=UPI0029C80A87|nr:hypothetical protein [uncultured Desulfobulbus sp.]
MKERFIELAELVVDVAISQNNRSSLDCCSKESSPPEYKGRLKVRHTDGTITDDNRFEPSFNIFPNVLSETARLINQALHINDNEFLWWEYDFNKKNIHSSGNSPQIKNRAIDILTYATNHDCWNYNHFWDKDGDIKDLIYIEKTDAAGLLDRQNIKYSFDGEKKINEYVNKQPQETDQQFCERLKNKGLELNIITRALKKQYKGICAFRVGVLLCPLTKLEISNSKDPAGLQRSRARKLIKQSNEEDNW